MVLSSALCLAMTVYGEARGESHQGQLAVAQVVINRTKHPDHPSTVCSAALEEGQFAPVKSFSDVKEPDAFLVAMLVSMEVLLENQEDPTLGATHFFSGSHIPYWAGDMLVVGRIGDHTFLRER